VARNAAPGGKTCPATGSRTGATESRDEGAKVPRSPDLMGPGK
jgi:hypothetical protein